MRRTALALVLAATLAGCGGSEPTIPSESLNELVLRQQDLGTPYQQFAGGKQGHLDNQAPRDDPTRYGREGVFSTCARTTPGAISMSSTRPLRA